MQEKTNNTNIDNLAKFGQEYQSKIIASLIYDLKFLKQIEDALQSDFFESEAHQWLIDKIKEYYKNYKTNITLEVIKVELEKEKNEAFKEGIIKKLKDAYEHKDDPDLKYIKDEFIKFCTTQNWKRFLLDGVEFIKNDDLESFHVKYKQACVVGQDRDLGLSLLEKSAKEILEESKRNTVKTPWEIINELTEGGIAPSETGELFIVVGAPGGGKTWTLCNAGYAALLEGTNVVHYSLELSKKMVAKRYYSLFTKIPAKELKYNEAEIDKQLKHLNDKKGKLIIKTYPTKRATINTLNSHINALKQEGILEDENFIIVVDYGDLLKAPKFYKDKRLEIGNIYEELRGFSGDINIPIWTGSQSNREGGKSNIIEGEHISEDYSKIMIGDFIFSISRKKEDNASKTARIYIIKNRFGADKIYFPGSFNVNNGHLEIFDSESIQGKELDNKMNGNHVRKILKEKYFKE